MEYMNRAIYSGCLSTEDCPVRASNGPVELFKVGKWGIGACFKRFQGRPDVFPGVSCSPHFRFLDPGVCNLHALHPAADGLTCRFAAGHRHAGERQEIVTRNRVRFCDILS
jgi:hypothetical protein